MSEAPIINIDMGSFWDDPYPAMESMRAAGPVVFVPQLDGHVMLGRDHIDHWEKQIDIFSSEQPGGLMTELMGKNMMRCDADAHQRQRNQIRPALSPRTVATHWRAAFAAAAEDILTDLAPRGAADLCTDYAMLLSGEALRIITGLNNISATEMDWTSQAMIDGIANYGGDPDVRQRCVDAAAFLDRAIDARIEALTAAMPDADSAEGTSIIAVLVRAEAPRDELRANVKLAISGGQNEPRDAIAGAAWALLTHPDQLVKAMDGTVEWGHVFDEYVRWMSPIGMSPRRIARDALVENVQLTEGSRAFFLFSAANRDPAHFDVADQFDIERNTKKHIAFGAGPHFCAGAFASRALVADVALPMLFKTFPDLTLDPAHETRFGGWAFRGPLSVRVRWTADR